MKHFHPRHHYMNLTRKKEDLQILSSINQLQSVTEKVTFQPTTMHNENSIEIPFQESCKINDSQQVEESSQNVKRREKRNKKHTRGMKKENCEFHKQYLTYFNCSQVELECLIGVNEGESRGRRKSQVNYAEPNLRRFSII